MVRMLRLICFLFLLPASLQAQEGNIWVTNGGYRLDFNTGSPALSSGHPVVPNPGTASVCDDNGQLLFYSDGYRVWDAQDQVSPGSDSLLPFTMGPQAISLVRQPGSNLFYLLATTNKLHYAVIEYQEAPGISRVVVPLQTIDMQTHGSMAVKTTCQNSLVWVAVDANVNVQEGTDQIYFFKIDHTGFHPQPVIMDPVALANFSVGNQGSLSFSPSTNRIVSATSGNQQPAIFMADFDPVSGVCSNIKFLPFQEGWSCVFSPSGQYLYVSRVWPPSDAGIYQLDVSLPFVSQIMASKQLVTPVTQGFSRIVHAPGGVMLGILQNNDPTSPNYQRTMLRRILQPNLAAPLCQYTPQPWSFHPGFPSIPPPFQTITGRQIRSGRQGLMLALIFRFARMRSP